MTNRNIDIYLGYGDNQVTVEMYHGKLGIDNCYSLVVRMKWMLEERGEEGVHQSIYWCVAVQYIGNVRQDDIVRGVNKIGCQSPSCE